ncbi:MAG: hypothetical protein M3319_04000 [Actinomycetota bacterium]|nr:hypothetical protein [Actinomycetota bacterium]MDQ3899632.1 hypothetical protein [Actinomycetota bacterium]
MNDTRRGRGDQHAAGELDDLDEQAIDPRDLGGHELGTHRPLAMGIESLGLVVLATAALDQGHVGQRILGARLPPHRCGGAARGRPADAAARGAG